MGQFYHLVLWEVGSYNELFHVVWVALLEVKGSVWSTFPKQR